MGGGEDSERSRDSSPIEESDSDRDPAQRLVLPTGGPFSRPVFVFASQVRSEVRTCGMPFGLQSLIRAANVGAGIHQGMPPTTPGMTPGNETPAGHAFFIEQAKFSW